MIFIGIDPGASGGIACIWESGNAEAWKMPETERDAFECVEQFGHWPSFAIIEQVSAMPGNGVSGMFRFGQSYGFLRGLLVSTSIPFDQVRPVVWQKKLGIPPRGKKSQVEHKNILKSRAQQLFPNVKITHATADALLLAEYARRTWTPANL